MVRRDTEREHVLVAEFKRICPLYDLQGLLMDANNNFTAAVEAFTLPEDEKLTRVIPQTGFSEEQWHAMLALANELGVCFNLFIYDTKKGRIHHCVVSEKSFAENRFDSCMLVNDKYFVDWWKKHKGTVQTKGYRPDLEQRISKSYFDKLLEKNNLKWGGNIDGFIVDHNSGYKPRAIVENRVTTKQTIKKYDPAIYYDDDRKTWLPLFMICSKLQIPLFLCTYSARVDEERYIGVTQVDVSQQEQLTYDKDLKPFNNLFTNLEDAREWIHQSITT